MFFLFDQEFLHFLIRALQRLLNTSVAFLLLYLFLLSFLVLLVRVSKIVFELFDDVEICVGDLRVVLLYVGVLLRVFRRQLLNCMVLLSFDPSDLCFPLFLHIVSKQQHLVLERKLDLAGDALVLLPDISLLLVVYFSERVEVLLVTHLLFFLGNLQASDVLLQLALGDAMIVLRVLQGDLGFFFQLSPLVLILKNEML